MAAPGENNTKAAGRYNQLLITRSPYLTRARSNAELTIPGLFPPEGSSGFTELVKPYQSLGSRGVNNLSAKLLLALFPPNLPFFRLQLPASALAELGTAAGQLRTKVDEGLGKIEEEVQLEFDGQSYRASIHEAAKQLLVAGNVCIQELPKGGCRYHRLDRYVVKRSPDGKWIEAVIHEKVAPAALPEEFLARLKLPEKARRDAVEENLDVYTWLRRRGDQIIVHQEVNGEKVPGTDGQWPEDRCPFLFLRWSKVDGEDYGRAAIDELYGDLRSLEGLTASIVEGSAAMAKILVLVDPTGLTSQTDVADSPNLAVRPGRKADVGVVGTEKSSDFSVALNTIATIERRLSASFLMVSSVQRQAERVTAEEIRLLAGELEEVLGGVYSLLAQEFQVPFVKALMARLERSRRIPSLPRGIRPVAKGGLEALGRSHELNRFMAFSRAATEILGPETVARALKPNQVLTMIGTSLGVKTEEFVKSEEELAADAQQSQQAALADRLGPEVIRARAQAATQETPPNAQ